MLQSLFRISTGEDSNCEMSLPFGLYILPEDSTLAASFGNTHGIPSGMLNRRNRKFELRWVDLGWITDSKKIHLGFGVVELAIPHEQRLSVHWLWIMIDMHVQDNSAPSLCLSFNHVKRSDSARSSSVPIFESILLTGAVPKMLLFSELVRCWIHCGSDMPLS